MDKSASQITVASQVADGRPNGTDSVRPVGSSSDTMDAVGSSHAFVAIQVSKAAALRLGEERSIVG